MTSILKVDELQDTSGNLIIKEDSNTITIGASGDTITIPSGATITNSGTATGFGESNKPAFNATMSSQSLANGSYTKLQFGTEVVDTNSAYDNSSNYRFTVPSGEAGLYYFSAMTQVAGIDDGERAQIVFYLNGNKKDETMNRDYSSGSDQSLYVTAVGTFNLSVGDYVETYVYHNEGSSVTGGYGQFTGFKVCTV